MKSIKLLWILAIIICLSFFEMNYAQDSKITIKAKTNEFLKKLTSEKGFSGAVLISRNKKVLLDQGYGFADLKKGAKVKNKTKFYIASITKQFTAAAILKLEEQRKLKLNEPITRFFKDVPSDKNKITIKNLLTHTAGFAQNYAADGVVDRGAAVEAILGTQLKNPVGEKFLYSNDGYTLLAAIIEIASKQTYENFLLENLLKQAKMSDTGFWGDKNANIAAMKKEISPDVKIPNWGFRGGVGMYSTVGDLYKWQQALFSDKILTKSRLEEFFTPNNETAKGMHAFGWFISKSSDGMETFWTGGYEDFGHNGAIKTFKDGIVIIVLTNSGDIDDKPARDVAGEGIERIIFNKTLVKNNE